MGLRRTKMRIWIGGLVDTRGVDPFTQVVRHSNGCGAAVLESRRLLCSLLLLQVVIALGIDVE